jgi:hypothetical protein
MKPAWLALISVAVLFMGGLGAGCGDAVTDPCTCSSCSHPYGACPGEIIPSDGHDADAADQ